MCVCVCCHPGYFFENARERPAKSPKKRNIDKFKGIIPKEFAVFVPPYTLFDNVFLRRVDIKQNFTDLTMILNTTFDKLGLFSI